MLICGQDKIDLNDDGEIQYSEAAAYDDLLWLACEGAEKISDITGIKSFINIKRFWMESGNDVNEIDLSGMVNIEEIKLMWNYKLEKVNISGCRNLASISCNENNIKYLNAENCIKLKSLGCSNNSLEVLKLLNCNNLKSLSLGKNNLENLELQQCINLEGVNCSNNKLTELDFSPLKNFKRLAGNNNQLIKVNVHNGNNNSITQFKTSGNPNLKCIEVDDPAYSKENWKEIDEWTEFSEDCSSSINESKINTFRVYPNPAKNTVFIERESVESADLKIVDITGRNCMIYHIQCGETQIQLDITKLSAGKYIIDINNETNSLIIE